MSKTNPLGFSTLGCPAWDLEQILSAARDYGFDAVELRGYRDQIDLPLAEPFTPANRAETRKRFEDKNLAVCCVSSSGIVAKNNLDHVKSHAELAADLGCERVRVFGGKLPDDLPHEDGIAQFAEILRSFGDAAQEAGVQIVLETHDSFSRGAEVAELLAATAHPAVFALWDLHHPYRQGETPEETYRFLGAATRYVHIKDGKDGTYTLLGDGDVPVIPMLDLLTNSGYSGPLTLEWEKRWKPALPEPEVAFPQYVKVMRAYLDRA